MPKLRIIPEIAKHFNSRRITDGGRWLETWCGKLANQAVDVSENPARVLLMGCGGTVPIALGKVVHDGFVTLFERALDVLGALPFGSNRCMNDETKWVP